jgi:hypothetical protein
LDEAGSLELASDSAGTAPVIKRVPVEAEARDDDGVVVHALLHVIDGRPAELEIFKDDSSPVVRMPSAAEFEVIILPPAPMHGSRKAI